LQRLSLAAPIGLVTALTAGWRTTGIFAVMYAAAIAIWWSRHVWHLAASRLPPRIVGVHSHQAPSYRQRSLKARLSQSSGRL
jgi:hypothetical protein